MPVRTSLRILNHNAYWFQGEPFFSDQPGAPRPDVLAALAKLYRGLDPLVICLQEVQSEAACKELAARLGMAGMYTPGNDLPQYGGAMFWDPARACVVSRCVSEHGVQRMWQTVSFELAGQVLHVTNLHLSSERQLRADEARESRVHDLGLMLEASPRPDVICGDFNEGPGSPSNSMLRGRGYIDAAAWADAPPVSTGKNKGQSDQIWLSGALAESMRAFAWHPMDALATDLEGLGFLSDHIPLWIDIALDH